MPTLIVMLGVLALQTLVPTTTANFRAIESDEEHTCDSSLIQTNARPSTKPAISGGIGAPASLALGKSRLALEEAARAAAGSAERTGQKQASALGEESYTIHFKWYPSTPYTTTQVPDKDPTQWWRCGTAGVPTLGDDGTTWFCGTTAPVSPDGFAPDLQNTGGDCQTLGPLAVRQHDDNSVFFWVEDSAGQPVDTVVYGGDNYSPILVLFESDYCTGPAHEFFAKQSYVPLDRDQEGPGLLSFKSVRIYFKPQDVGLPTEAGLGIKTVIFPFTDMYPYDETSCVKDAAEASGGKFLYTPFVADGWDPKLHCVSPDDRVSCIPPDNSQQYAAIAGSDGAGYGCLDFAGCWICNVEGEFSQSLCEASECHSGVFEEQEYCKNSPVWALDRSVAGGYPLGSFYYHLYLTTHDASAYCDDSIATDASGLSPDVCVQGTALNAKYQGKCVATRFHDCSGRVDPQRCGDNACPDANALPYHWVSSTIEDLCGPARLTGSCYKPIKTEADPDNPIQCGLMKYRDENGIDGDSDEYPLKTTCWTTRIVDCADVNGQWSAD